MAVVFIDKSVPGYLALLDELSEHFLVHILDNNQNALRQIANIIGNDSNLGSLHIVSHGEPGILKFSSGSITTDNVKNFSTNYTTYSCIKNYIFSYLAFFTNRYKVSF